MSDPHRRAVEADVVHPGTVGRVIIMSPRRTTVPFGIHGESAIAAVRSPSRRKSKSAQGPVWRRGRTAIRSSRVSHLYGFSIQTRAGPAGMPDGPRPSSPRDGVSAIVPRGSSPSSTSFSPALFSSFCSLAARFDRLVFVFPPVFAATSFTFLFLFFLFHWNFW
jgi:hypothetical protein